MDAASLVDYRIRKQLSQSQAAAALGISVRTWQQWEQGRRKPGGKVWEKLESLVLDLVPVRAESVAFSDALKSFREAKGLCQPDAAVYLSERAGFKISLGALRSWEEERRTPRCEVIAHLVPVLQEVVPSYLDRQRGNREGSPLELTPLEKILRDQAASKRKTRRKKTPLVERDHVRLERALRDPRSDGWSREVKERCAWEIRQIKNAKAELEWREWEKLRRAERKAKWRRKNPVCQLAKARGLK